MNNMTSLILTILTILTNCSWSIYWTIVLFLTLKTLNNSTDWPILLTDSMPNQECLWKRYATGNSKKFTRLHMVCLVLRSWWNSYWLTCALISTGSYLGPRHAACCNRQCQEVAVLFSWSKGFYGTGYSIPNWWKTMFYVRGIYRFGTNQLKLCIYYFCR